MKTVAVASATFILMLMISDTAFARQSPGELRARHIAGSVGPIGVRVAADELKELAVKQLQGVPGVPLQLDLSAPGYDLKFAMFRGISPNIHFTHGFRSNNNWFVASGDLGKVALINVQDTTAPVAFEILYFRDSNQPPVAQRLVFVNFTERMTRGEAGDLEASQERSGTSAVGRNLEVEENGPPAEPKISTKQENADVQRATALLRNGDISSARRVLEYLASRGSAKGARMLAETYDPAFLKDMIIAGLRPDVEQAKHWYERAAELGDDKAAKRLSALDTR